MAELTRYPLLRRGQSSCCEPTPGRSRRDQLRLRAALTTQRARRQYASRTPGCLRLGSCAALQPSTDEHGGEVFGAALYDDEVSRSKHQMRPSTRRSAAASRPPSPNCATARPSSTSAPAPAPTSSSAPAGSGRPEKRSGST